MDEILDLYDKEKKLVGITVKRGDDIPSGLYFRSVSAWIVNDNCEYLLSQRHPKKAYPNYWECTGGLVRSGENVLDAAIREVKEELGIDLDIREGKILFSKIREERQDIYDVWIFNITDRKIKLTLQEDEVVDAKWVKKHELIQMYKAGLLHPLIDYIDKL